MDELEKLRAAGFSEPQIQEYAKLKAAGFSASEIDAHFSQAPSPFADMVNTATTAGPATGAAVSGLGAAGMLGVGGYALYGKKPAGSRRMAEAVQESGGLPALKQQLDAFKTAGRGDLPTLGDLSPRMGAAADFVSTSHEPTRLALGAINAERQAGVPGRVGQDIAQLAPGGAVAPRQEIAQTGADKAAFAQSEAGFEGLRQKNVILRDPVSLATELQKPENKPLLNSYLEARAQSLSAGGSGAPSFRVLQDMKRDLDQRITAAFTTGNGDLGKELKGARERLFDIMEQQVGPQYRSAVSTYRQMSRQQELLQEGLDFWKSRDMQLADIQGTIKDLNPAELESFRRGVAGGLLTQVENAKTNSNVARQLLKESAVTEKKLNLIFGGEANAKAFMGRMRLEDQLARMGEIVGQSATARRLQSLSEPLVEGEDVFHTLAHPASGIANWFSKVAGSQRIAKQAAKGMAPAFTQQGTPALEELLRNLSRLPR